RFHRFPPRKMQRKPYVATLGTAPSATSRATGAAESIARGARPLTAQKPRSEPHAGRSESVLPRKSSEDVRSTSCIPDGDAANAPDSTHCRYLTTLTGNFVMRNDATSRG